MPNFPHFHIVFAAGNSEGLLRTKQFVWDKGGQREVYHLECVCTISQARVRAFHDGTQPGQGPEPSRCFQETEGAQSVRSV